MYDFAKDEENHKSQSKLNVKTRSSNKLLLRIKRPHTEKFKKSLAYRNPKKWNGLTEKFHSTHSKSKYKSLVMSWIEAKATANENNGNGSLGNNSLLVS